MSGQLSRHHPEHQVSVARLKGENSSVNGHQRNEAPFPSSIQATQIFQKHVAGSPPLTSQEEKRKRDIEQRKKHKWVQVTRMACRERTFRRANRLVSRTRSHWKSKPESPGRRRRETTLNQPDQACREETLCGGVG